MEHWLQSSEYKPISRHTACTIRLTEMFISCVLIFHFSVPNQSRPYSSILFQKSLSCDFFVSTRLDVNSTIFIGINIATIYSKYRIAFFSLICSLDKKYSVCSVYRQFFLYVTVDCHAIDILRKLDGD